MKSNYKGRVAMLMSGGVDSSVSAALLKDQGYEVIGFYILGWLGTPEFPCPWQKEEQDARKVAEQLQIPFYTVNLSAEYEREVINEFFKAYQAGVTPNPDILCNREIKFKALWDKIRQFEPDFIATGHYARSAQIPITNNQIPNKFKSPKSKIYKAGSYGPAARSQQPEAAIFVPKDRNKDQTYFLWGIDPTLLPKILFPLGELTKPEVRQLAKKYQLPTATKKDSQGICFVGPLKVRQFLASRLQTQPGDVYLVDGRKIASHQGVQFYTIGQRLGAGSVNWTGDIPPLFVIAKDIDNNRLIVGSDRDTFATELVATSPNWLSLPTKSQFAVMAKIRYRQEDVPAQLTTLGHKLLVKFNQPVRAITPGQSIVFYDNDQLLGGAVVTEVKAQDETITRLAQAVDTAQV